MAGDYTRFTYRPEDNHSGVLMQQGRVQLDADWNELVELLDRRTRVESVDVIGRCGVPDQTPDGFLIGGTASVGLTIGVGRCYVDGLLAENRGSGEALREEIWGERVHKDPAPYDGQPYLQPAPKAPTTGGPHLVYLDVWEREVTAVEEPALVEPAVGVDTATRLQTVWAVRILKNMGGGVKCDSDWSKVKRWLERTRPSGARLSTAAVGTTKEEDPCQVAPQGGYRGVDNRLYRIEVHDDGSDPDRPASFKWSRDNGSVAVEVLSITGPKQKAVRVGVRRIGRDGTLRFKEGDWIELLDDQLEIAGRPGVMAKIAPNGVDPQTNELTLEGPLDGAIDVKRNPRARRWDQQEDVNERGVIETGEALPSSFPLEDGIEVTFDLEAPGSYRVGDYWVFAARASGEEGTVEELVREPPRGIRHHYCRLAILEKGAPVEDCRVHYPPKPPPAGKGCDCDVCVTPKSHAEETLTIQDAVRKVAKTGGRVCLAAGRYPLRKPLRIYGARSVTLAGKGARTVIEYRGKGPAIEISYSIEVTIEKLAVATGGGGRLLRNPELGIAVTNTVGVTIQRCFLGQAAAFLGQAGKHLTRRATIESKRPGGVAIGLGGLVASTAIRENVIVADIGIATLPALASAKTRARGESMWSPRGREELKVTGLTRQPRYMLTIGLWIEDNLLACGRAAVDLGRVGAAARRGQESNALILHLGETRIAGNAAYGCFEVGILVAGMVPHEGGVVARSLMISGGNPRPISPLPRLGGIALAATAGGSHVEIARNQLSVAGFGIAVGSDETRVAGNEVGPYEEERESSNGGIYALGGWGSGALQGLEILGNRVQGVGGDAIAISGPAEDARVAGNTVRTAGGSGVALTDGTLSSTLLVSENEIHDVGAAAEAEATVGGIVIAGADRAEVLDNVVAGVSGDATPRSRVGVSARAVRELKVSGNEVRALGPEQEFSGMAVGIGIDDAFERASIAGNVVRLEPRFGDRVSRVNALNVGSGYAEEEVAAAVVIGEEGGAVRESSPGSLAVHGNLLEAGGREPAVLMSVLGHLAFGDNRCRVDGEGPKGAIARVTVREGALSATANHFTGSPEVDSLAITVDYTRTRLPAATVVGNVGDGPFEINGRELPPPWTDLNIQT